VARNSEDWAVGVGIGDELRKLDVSRSEGVEVGLGACERLGNLVSMRLGLENEPKGVGASVMEGVGL